MGDKRCEAEGCTLTVPSYMLMCPRHWMLVPSELKRAVYATWNDRRVAGGPARIVAVEAHEQAKRDAIAAVREGVRGE